MGVGGGRIKKCWGERGRGFVSIHPETRETETWVMFELVCNSPSRAMGGKEVFFSHKKSIKKSFDSLIGESFHAIQKHT